MLCSTKLPHQKGTRAFTDTRIWVSRHYGCMLEVYCIRKQELWNLCFFRGWRKWQLIEQMQPPDIQHWFMTFFRHDRGTTGRLQLSDEEHYWCLTSHVCLPHNNRKKKKTHFKLLVAALEYPYNLHLVTKADQPRETPISLYVNTIIFTIPITQHVERPHFEPRCK